LLASSRKRRARAAARARAGRSGRTGLGSAGFAAAAASAAPSPSARGGAAAALPAASLKHLLHILFVSGLRCSQRRGVSGVQRAQAEPRALHALPRCPEPAVSHAACAAYYTWPLARQEEVLALWLTVPRSRIRRRTPWPARSPPRRRSGKLSRRCAASVVARCCRGWCRVCCQRGG